MTQIVYSFINGFVLLVIIGAVLSWWHGKNEKRGRKKDTLLDLISGVYVLFCLGFFAGLVVYALGPLD